MNRYKYFDSAGEHLHTLDGRPLVGTSRVGSILAKPLSWYGAGKAVEVFGCPDPKVLTKIKNKKATPEEISKHTYALGLYLEMIKRFTVDDYCALIDKAYRAHDVYKRSRAKTGTDLHAECEKFVKQCMYGLDKFPYETYPDEIIPFAKWTRENVKRFLWSEGHCYSEKHWLGGISDAGYETKDGKYGILDFKSSKEAYMDQFWQCAGYAIQIEENGILDADGNQVLDTGQFCSFDEVCVFPFGGEKPRPYFHEDMAGSKEAFLAELLIYKKLPQE
jgi:hypothetical protein